MTSSEEYMTPLGPQYFDSSQDTNYSVSNEDSIMSMAVSSSELISREDAEMNYPMTSNYGINIGYGSRYVLVLFHYEHN